METGIDNVAQGEDEPILMPNELENDCSTCLGDGNDNLQYDNVVQGEDEPILMPNELENGYSTCLGDSNDNLQYDQGNGQDNDSTYRPDGLDCYDGNADHQPDIDQEELLAALIPRYQLRDRSSIRVPERYARQVPVRDELPT